MVLLRELVAGSTRFNDLRRGLPRISPSLLSQRLKELEAAGVVERVVSLNVRSNHEYRLTKAGLDLRGVVEAVGFWGQRWIDADLSLENLDASLLMWDMRRSLNTTPFPNRRSVIEFQFTDQPAFKDRWWLIVDPEDGVDLCSVEPGFDVDLFVTTGTRSLTAVWMGLSTVKSEQKSKSITLHGDTELARNMQKWLGLSHFAAESKLVGA